MLHAYFHVHLGLAVGEPGCDDPVHGPIWRAAAAHLEQRTGLRMGSHGHGWGPDLQSAPV